MNSSHNHRRRFSVLIVIAVLGLISIACQFGDLFFASGEPQPVERNLDSTTALHDFQDAKLPIEDVTVADGAINVTMTYGYQSNLPSPARFNEDIKAMAKLMCKYDRVYDLEAHYTDKWTFKLEYHFIRGLCDGIDAVVPEDQLIYEGYYKTPQGEWIRVTPMPQK